MAIHPTFEGDDLLLIPRGLIGAACHAIDKKIDAPKVLAMLHDVAMSKSTSHELPPCPKPTKLRRQQRCDGGYDMVPAYNVEEMEAYARAALTRAKPAGKAVENNPVGRFTGNFHFDANGKAIFEVKAYGSLPTVGAKLYAEQPAQVPDGYVLVPIDVDDEMVDAGCLALSGSIGGYEAGKVYKCWDAMLASAPQPKGGE
ncbi:hypothetical protein [Paludibacterium denitrificans]|uniref:Uncharacterized protein n=1 Tax=Paludibacterium denitrificans TaxID=2675226 RepID=A0A844GBC7_9NEIS|nr:hypothetical protein [Paludibacterium denitrificans]MTD32601.1 hypothetical protein [Paludibacterium denitrificans]